MLDTKDLAKSLAIVVKEQLEKATQPLRDDVAALNERPLPQSMDDIKAVVEIMISDALVKNMPQPLPVEPDIAAVQELVTEAVEKAVSALPVPQDGKSVTVEELEEPIHNAVEAAVQRHVEDRVKERLEAVLPDALTEVIKQSAVEAAKLIPVPQDGKSVTVEELEEPISSVVESAVERQVAPKVKAEVEAALPEAIDGLAARAAVEASKLIRVPEDGKSVTVEELREPIAAAVDQAVKARVPEQPEIDVEERAALVESLLRKEIGTEPFIELPEPIPFVPQLNEPQPFTERSAAPPIQITNDLKRTKVKKIVERDERGLITGITEVEEA